MSSERKREEEDVKASPIAKDIKEKAMQTAVDTGKAVADISADERFYNRSVRIRRKIMLWMSEHVGERFDSLGEMEAQAANFAKCSMPCARRWLFQFAQPGMPFHIQELADFYVVRER